jgi:hypothetical protein
MLPEHRSTDLTSLNYEADRSAIVIEMVVAADGSLEGSELYRAVVRNRAKLAYNSVAGRPKGNGPMPRGIGTVSAHRAIIGRRKQKRRDSNAAGFVCTNRGQNRLPFVTTAKPLYLFGRKLQRAFASWRARNLLKIVQRGMNYRTDQSGHALRQVEHWRRTTDSGLTTSESQSGYKRRELCIPC